MTRILLLLFFLAPSTCFAMCTASNYELAAWNPAGNAVIMHEVTHGPEGGGADLYLVGDFDKARSETYKISNRVSPGDGSIQEHISTYSCKESLVKANQSLASLGFKSKFRAKCHLGRSDMLSFYDEDIEPLDSDKVITIAKALGLSGEASTLFLSTKDNVHFISVENNDSCLAKCRLILFDTTHNLYRKIGECNPPLKQ